PAWLALAALALVAGCAASGGHGPQAGIPTGSELVLHQRLTLAPESARIYLQDGQVVAPSEVDRARTACALRLRRRGDEPLVEAIEPGRFLAIDGGGAWAEPARMMASDRGFPHAPQRYEFHTQLEIRSDQQPQVDSLHCSREDWRTGDVPRREDIEQALGDKARVQLPPPAPR
ncbi:MAG: hypothetical protein WD382_05780, partial [Halofilum sp. (in: g-proteobacteria)]